ncbi:transposase [Glaciihabitans sp. UYNi722]|uniref:transposase n=1 Tax=Glaciihabitans sp. UYNi722 TaxID=3156344 RepID=UPI0033942B91
MRRSRSDCSTLLWPSQLFRSGGWLCTRLPRPTSGRSHESCDRSSELAPGRLATRGTVRHRSRHRTVVGDNPERIRSEAALAKRAGISPIPASSGMTSGRHRINHGGHWQLNAAIYRTVIVRMRFHQPTTD